jgi:replication factor C subunit 3/5
MSSKKQKKIDNIARNYIFGEPLYCSSDEENDSVDKYAEFSSKRSREIDRTRLPFVERFRPKTLDGIMSHCETIQILKKFITQHNIPHLLFYGPPGTGKTSTIEAFINELYGEEYVDYVAMKINASEERGIEIVRNKIKDFVSTMPIKMGSPNAPKYKFIILDEADAMTFDAQGMLKQVIEFYTDNARFCLICNCNKKINPAIQSRCAVFNFPPLDFLSVKRKIQMISEEFKLTITEDGIETIWKLSNGDMRKVMHMLQVISIDNKIINSDKVTTLQKYPTKDDIDKIYDLFMKGDLKVSLSFFKSIMKAKHYSLMDILTELTHKVIESIAKGELDSVKGGDILLDMRDVEMNIIVTTDTDIQLTNLVCIFTK